MYTTDKPTIARPVERVPGLTVYTTAVSNCASPHSMSPVTRKTRRRPKWVMTELLIRIATTPTEIKMHEFSKALPMPAIWKKYVPYAVHVSVPLPR